MSKNAVFKRLPVSIWTLGLVSMFMDISSKMIFKSSIIYSPEPLFVILLY
jgi:hypothetical protein